MRPAFFEHPAFADYALLDSGEGEKLERFGEVVLVRPDPQALWRRRLDESAWRAAHLTFVRESDRGGRWEAVPDAPAVARGKEPSWTVRFDDATFVIRPTPFKHVGLFPEQATNWRWMRAACERLGPDPPKLLNLFGYTGAASVLGARAGYRATHVDASKTSIAWARENVRASGLPDDAVRVLLEDARTFVAREARRGNRYEGILIDPPHYGRGPKGEKWQFEENIAELFDGCCKLLAERSFLCLSTYAIGFLPTAFTNMLQELEGGTVEAGELVLPEEDRPDAAGRLLSCGVCARWSRGLDP